LKKALIIIPTYNEAENIVNIINELMAINYEGVIIEILVVDDNSTDGTGSLVKNLSNQRVHIIERPAKMGLGTAYIRGFGYAIENSYDYVFEMDADFSHDPEAIPAFFDKLNDYDLVIGSRYIEGIAVVNWPLSRLMISIGASYYTRMITFLPVKDVTAGFMAYRVPSLKQIDFEKVHSNGYSFQIEMKFRMSRKIVYEAMFMVWKLKFQSIFNKL
jgi:dolichol-phosphate mannosyltransferase